MYQTTIVERLTSKTTCCLAKLRDDQSASAARRGSNPAAGNHRVGRSPPGPASRHRPHFLTAYRSAFLSATVDHTAGGRPAGAGRNDLVPRPCGRPLSTLGRKPRRLTSAPGKPGWPTSTVNQSAQRPSRRRIHIKLGDRFCQGPLFITDLSVPPQTKHIVHSHLEDRPGSSRARWAVVDGQAGIERLLSLPRACWRRAASPVDH